MLSYSRSILARWRKYFSQILNVHWVNDVRDMEIHTAEPLEHETCASEFESAIQKLNSHKSPVTDQIPAELFNS